MAANDAKHALVATEDAKAGFRSSAVISTASTIPKGLELTQLPTEEDGERIPAKNPRWIFHIYSKHEVHKCITPVTDPTKERRAGPTVKELKAKREEKKVRKTSGLPLVDPDDNAFFLHKPYLAFHLPPRVLYVGNTKHGTKPAVLIHEGWFWKEYKLQLGPSIAQAGVIDPRGVVAWKHNGGDKEALKADDRKLKGYKVRTWRLWGETGKEYVHSVKNNRKAGERPDPDTLGNMTTTPERADEVVYLKWTHPFSRHTRRYHFRYVDIDFYWKGTGTVKEPRRCGSLLRFNHLKLVAQIPLTSAEIDQNPPEVCLGKFTSSVASKKNGSLELFDTAILRLIEEYAPAMLAQDLFGDQVEKDQATVEEDQNSKLRKMKRSTLYQVIVATATCMVITEKEKRHTLLDFLLQAAEGGGAGG